jgi:NTE family protein
MTAVKIGLALGGGGARGIAHIPMLEVFDELGLVPATVAGCSMGALVGACYAGGMSGKELREHCIQLLSNRIEFAKYVFGSRKTKLTDLLSLHSLASLHLSGEKLADLALPDYLPKNIEDTKIPLKLIATDYEQMLEVVLSSGSMITAVGASIAIPGLIAAPKINGRIHVDGGIVNPVPFDKVLEGNDIVVAIDVTGKPRPVTNKNASNIELAIGSLLIMFNQLAETRRALSPPDIYIVPNVDQFSSGDFFRVKEMLAAAEPAKEHLKRLLDKQINATLIGGT